MSSPTSRPVSVDATTVLVIGGMSCGHCAQHVEEALVERGAAGVDVDLASGRAVVRHPDALTPDELARAVEDAGYDVERARA